MLLPAANLKNDNGAIMLLMSMMILMLLTIISFAASRTAITEVRIAGNEYQYQKNFYCAEGAAAEAVDRMEGLAAVNVADHAWMMNESSNVAEDEDIFEYWTAEPETADDAVPETAAVCAASTEFIAIHRGALPGNSLDMSKPTKHAFRVYGQCRQKGRVLIKVGYMKEY